MERCVWNGAGWVFRPGDQLFFAVILHFPHLAAHQLPEHKVNRIGYAAPAAKVFVQNHFGRIFVFVRVISRIGFFPAQKDFRHSLAEPVDALFDIPHHKKIIFLPGNCPENHILCFVGVLVLVYHYLVKLQRKFFGRLCADKARPGRAHQQAQRPMFQIPKVRNTPGRFTCVQYIPKLFDGG